MTQPSGLQAPRVPKPMSTLINSRRKGAMKRTPYAATWITMKVTIARPVTDLPDTAERPNAPTLKVLPLFYV